ncbi:MAG: hypothetical protein EHM31_11620 [Candidatus Aminicenantes bacterium]|nr:MAG: hypothetical protein EHM31_11620 [Candidatus Aminicenantes bacterium]
MSRAALLLAFLSCAAFAAAVAVAAEPRGTRPQAGAPEIESQALSTLERAEILKGKIILREIPSPDRKGRTFEAVGVLLATVEEALSAITDYRRYGEFMPRVEKTVVTDESDSVSIVEQYLKLPLGVHRRYRLRFSVCRGDDGFRIEWKKLPWPEVPLSQSVVDTSGHWQVARFSEGGLLAFYQVYTDPGRVPLGMKGLALSLSRREIPKVIERVRERLRSLSAPRPVKYPQTPG